MPCQGDGARKEDAEMTNAMVQGFGEMGAALAKVERAWGVFVKMSVRGREVESCKMFDVTEARAKEFAKHYQGGYARPM